MAYTPTVWSDGDTITAEKLNKLEQGVSNEQVGPSGADGATFTPSVSSDGVLSFTNDGGLPNPEPVNIKGPPGEDGADGAPGVAGTDGQDGFSPTVSVTDITGGHRVTITDATGPHTFDVMDGQDGSGGGTAGVTSFNGRSGAVTPASGDYTATMVGAKASDWMPTAADVGARPNTWTPTAADVGAIPSGSVHAIQALTEAEYNALSTKIATTLYLIKE